MKELFDLFNSQLLDEGIIMKCGTINDGSFVDVPRRRITTKDENESHKKGKVPDSLKPIENPQTGAEKSHNIIYKEIQTRKRHFYRLMSKLRYEKKITHQTTIDRRGNQLYES